MENTSQQSDTAYGSSAEDMQVNGKESPMPTIYNCLGANLSLLVSSVCLSVSHFQLLQSITRVKCHLS